MQVETAQGVWHVRRRWAPRHLGSQTIWARFTDRTRRVRKRTTELGDVPDPGCAGDLAEGVVVFVVIVAVVVFLVFFGLPFLIALGELLLVVALALAGVIGRIFFRRPWTIDAVGPDATHHLWPVVGWRSSERARTFVAARLAETGTVPTAQEVAAVALAA